MDDRRPGKAHALAHAAGKFTWECALIPVQADQVDRRQGARPNLLLRQAKGFEAMDTGALEATVDEVIAAHPGEWEQFRTGDDKARGKLTGFFVGQVMRATQGKADGKAVTALLRQKAG